MSTEAATRAVLDPSRIGASARAKVSGYHRNVLDDVEAAVKGDRIVVIGMAQNPHVKRARAALDAAGVTHRYLEYGSYFSEWKPRLAIKMWSGWPTFPQVFASGELIGGADEVIAAIADGTLAK
jgi:glutaredoxin-related protein